VTSSAERLAAALADRYRIERELGAGGMATVYLAQDLKHDRKVALKLLKPELAAVLGAERFVAEIRTTAQLQHPHILPLHDSGQADGFLYYVMPYVEGETLRDRLNRERQLPVSDAVRIATEVAGALDYAHQHGIVHRDIKPENVLLSSGHAVVADFGIARAVGAAGGEQLTATGMAIGTPAYMSPEQSAGMSDVDGRSDTYALASVLYEMLAGEPPFTGQTAVAGSPSGWARRRRAPGCSARPCPRRSTRRFSARSQRAPADRFATASEFATALQAGSRSSPLRFSRGGRRGERAARDRDGRVARPPGRRHGRRARRRCDRGAALPGRRQSRDRLPARIDARPAAGTSDQYPADRRAPHPARGVAAGGRQ
jgi:serine/threonine-protein kinase